ncbi:aspartic proteinase CDR1-like [Malania oleifera]|uniref:aspartic proteinase CDR1-like n=1 Tax=Malania oleifera TaxID=397392 RepID=UPI0025ADA419|nr:aspartic proteinase CDR1-like [Malania oleifera]
MPTHLTPDSLLSIALAAFLSLSFPTTADAGLTLPLAQRLTTSPSSSPSTLSAQVSSLRGEYLINLLLGTKQAEILAVADTTGDLIWTQCLPCDECDQQKNPLYDPSNSSSYNLIPCGPACDAAAALGATCGNNTCRYSTFYLDYLGNSSTSGVLAKDTLTLGSTAFTNITIGCGRDNFLIFDDNAQGMVGLGRGPTSLVSQIREEIDGKFALCFCRWIATLNETQGINNTLANSSKIMFGARAEVSGEGTVTSAVVPGSSNSSYNLKVEKIVVGNETFTLNNVAVLSTASLLTLLPQEVLSGVRNVVMGAMGNQTRTEDPLQIFALCYQLRSDSDLDKAPNMTISFTGGDLELNWKNMFLNVLDDVACLAMELADGAEIVYGNVAMADFMVGYDLVKGTVSFKRAACAELSSG